MKRSLLMMIALVLCLSILAGCAKHGEDSQPGQEVWDVVVAQCGDHKLTNATLSYYFWSGYGAFLDYYDSNAQSILDLYTPLSEQQYTDDMTWEDYFVDNALTAFRQYSAICDLAEEKGFTLSQSNAAMLENLESELQATAEEMGFQSALEYLQTNYGPGASMESYREYMKDYLTVYEYVAKAQGEYQFSDAEVEANYDDNAASYAELGIEKDDRNMVSLRYLTLFEYDNAWEDANGETISSAGDVFDSLLEDWETSEDHSEAAFMQLGEVWSNYGVQQNYIERMGPNSGNEEQIEEWAFDEERQPGDYYALASNYGYFLLYFVKTCDTPYWYEQSLYDLQYTAFSQTINDRINSMDFSMNAEEIVIAESQDMYEAS